MSLRRSRNQSIIIILHVIPLFFHRGHNNHCFSLRHGVPSLEMTTINLHYFIITLLVIPHFFFHRGHNNHCFPLRHGVPSLEMATFYSDCAVLGVRRGHLYWCGVFLSQLAPPTLGSWHSQYSLSDWLLVSWGVVFGMTVYNGGDLSIANLESFFHVFSLFICWC